MAPAALTLAERSPADGDLCGQDPGGPVAVPGRPADERTGGSLDPRARLGLPGLAYRPSDSILIAGSADLPVREIQLDHVFC
jgi:hypothetical protein